jgi:cell division protein FtsQ
MDRGGCLAESLSEPARWGTAGGARRARAGRRGRLPPHRLLQHTGQLGAFARRLNARAERLGVWQPPRGAGVAAAALIIFGSIALGVVYGDHVDEVTGAISVARDTAADAVGFAITGVALSGNKHLSREEIFALAGVSPRTSTLFFDVTDARAKLKTNPWIADATVQKLYPDRLQIAIRERAAFALWQKEGRIGVIADDGTVLEPFISRGIAGLPLFVGEGAAPRAKDFLVLLDRYPDLRDNVAACVLVAERRWNLRLKNGVDVRLPEFDVAQALDRLVALDKENKLLSRDVVVVDLRLADRVTVRLSDEAAAARADALKAKKPKPKGSSA